MEFEKLIIEKFKELKLGRPRKITVKGRWAYGELWHVKTWVHEYTVVDHNGKIRTIKDLDKVYFRES